MDIAKRLKYLNEKEMKILEKDLEELSSMIIGLIKSLRSKK